MADNGDDSGPDLRTQRNVGAAEEGAIRRVEPISWTVHTVDSDDEGGSSSSSSSSSSDASDEDQSSHRRRADRLNERDRAERALRDNHALRLAHAMTHNPVDNLLPSPPRSPPRALADPYQHFTQRVTRGSGAREPVRIVTINDVKNRTCWICSDGDADETVVTTADGAASSKSVRRWLHPCKCSLMAHEDCLLTWIRTSRVSDRNKAIVCPQCAHPYNIVEYKSSILRLFETGNAFLNDAVVYMSIGAGACTAYLALTSYGIAAFRAFMGKEATKRAFGRGWAWHLYLELPCIPFLLVLSRIQPLDHVVINWMAWIPLMILFPSITPAPSASGAFRGRSLGGRGVAWLHPPALQHFGVLSARRPWPPGPIRLFFLIPWVRAVYAILKRKITRRVLAPFARRRRAVGNEPRTRRHTRLIIVGEEAPTEALNEDGTINVDETGLPHDLPPGAEAIENQETIYVSPRSLARLCCGTLSAPFIAKFVGGLLARLARHSTILRRFLGLQPLLMTLRGSPTLSNKASPSGARPSTRAGSYATPLANLISSGSFVPDKNIPTANASDTLPGYGTEPKDDTRWLEPSTMEFDDLDPAWFRNAIGLGMFVVLKDAVQLGYRYLRLEHARQAGKRTKIIDRPFVGGVVEQLELHD